MTMYAWLGGDEGEFVEMKSKDGLANYTRVWYDLNGYRRTKPVSFNDAVNLVEHLDQLKKGSRGSSFAQAVVDRLASKTEFAVNIANAVRKEKNERRQRTMGVTWDTDYAFHYTDPDTIFDVLYEMRGTRRIDVTDWVVERLVSQKLTPALFDFLWNTYYADDAQIELAGTLAMAVGCTIEEAGTAITTMLNAYQVAAIDKIAATAIDTMAAFEAFVKAFTSDPLSADEIDNLEVEEDDNGEAEHDTTSTGALYINGQLVGNVEKWDVTIPPFDYGMAGFSVDYDFNSIREIAYMACAHTRWNVVPMTGKEQVWIKTEGPPSNAGYASFLVNSYAAEKMRGRAMDQDLFNELFLLCWGPVDEDKDEDEKVTE